MKLVPVAASLAAALALITLPAAAQSKGDWTVGLGLGYVVPKEDNGSILNGTVDLDIGDNARPTLTAEYFIHDNVGIEILAAWPFEHSIMSSDLDGKIGSTKQLPPTVSLQYHFPTNTRYTPFAGVGLNYTTFWDTDTEGAIDGADLSLEDSWGVALHLGVDAAIGPHGSLRADVRWIDIDSDVKLNGDKVGTAEIDPWVFGVAYVMQF